MTLLLVALVGGTAGLRSGAPDRSAVDVAAADAVGVTDESGDRPTWQLSRSRPAAFGPACAGPTATDTLDDCERGAVDVAWTPFTLGDDVTLDTLWRDCAAGGLSACDQLWLTAPISSDYEAFASTCGGRRDPTRGRCA